ncbi:putative 26S proteasome regulatory subunit [Geranomyces michiganensis]|nr:putative 26S proteasome regulatory subunit [Geranomyces michiganensis]
MTAPTQEEATATAQALMARKASLESQITDLQEVLASHKTDLTSPLTDSDGFPRADIDVYTVRHVRVEILKLRNDHQEVMRKIESALQDVFRTGGGSGGATGSSLDNTLAGLLPFAKIGDVLPDSPAREGGLELGDEVVKFGSVSKASHPQNTLASLPSVVHENRPIRMVIRRAGKAQEITLIPHKWAGRGLLGCQFLPC